MENKVRGVGGRSPEGQTYPLLGGWHWIEGAVYCRGETYLGECTGKEIYVDGIHYREVDVPKGWDVWPT